MIKLCVLMCSKDLQDGSNVRWDASCQRRKIKFQNSTDGNVLWLAEIFCWDRICVRKVYMMERMMERMIKRLLLTAENQIPKVVPTAKYSDWLKFSAEIAWSTTMINYDFVFVLQHVRKLSEEKHGSFHSRYLNGACSREMEYFSVTQCVTGHWLCSIIVHVKYTCYFSYRWFICVYFWNCLALTLACSALFAWKSWHRWDEIPGR